MQKPTAYPVSSTEKKNGVEEFKTEWQSKGGLHLVLNLTNLKKLNIQLGKCENTEYRMILRNYCYVFDIMML